MAEIDAKKALAENAAGRKGASAAPGSIRAQRADFYENNVGKFLSIEANVDGVTYTGAGQNVYNGPTVMAEWYDAAGNKLGQGALVPYTDPDVTPDYYQYHYRIFRIGNKGDSTRRGRVDQGRVQQRRRRHARRQGMDLEGSAAELARPSSPASSRATTTRRTRTRRCATLAAEFPNIASVEDLPEKTWGYQRPAATMLGYVNTTARRPNATTPYVRFDDDDLPVAGAAPSTAQQPSTVVVTSKVMGHLGGNSLTARLVAPTGPNQALAVAFTGNAIRVDLGLERHGAVTSTANAGHRRASTRTRTRAASCARRSTAPRPATASSRRASPRRSATCCARRRTSRAARRRSTLLRIGKVARRLQGRRVPLLPGARGRDRDLGRLPRDRGAPRAQLRDRSPDDGARRQPRHLHRPADQRRRRDPLDLRLAAPHQHGSTTATTRPSHREPRRPGEPQQLRRQHQPQLLRRLGLRRLPGRDVTGCSGGNTPARSSSPSPRPATRSGSRTRSRTSSSRTTSTRPVATSCGRPAPTRRRACRCRTRRTAR